MTRQDIERRAEQAEKSVSAMVRNELLLRAEIERLRAELAARVVPSAEWRAPNDTDHLCAFRDKLCEALGREKALRAENERLRGPIRKAFQAGFYAGIGPADYSMVADERAWREWTAHEQQPIDGGENGSCD